MTLEKADLESIQTMISDGLAGAGEGLATQARTAATEAIEAGTAKFTGDIAKLSERLDKLPATPEVKDLDKIVSERVKAALAEQATAQAKTAEETAARRKLADAKADFIAKNAAKLPKEYHHLIPETQDAAALQAGVDAAMAAFKEGLAAAGITLPGMGTAAGGNPEANSAEADKAKAAEALKAPPGAALKKAYETK